MRLTWLIIINHQTSCESITFSQLKQPQVTNHNDTNITDKEKFKYKISYNCLESYLGFKIAFGFCILVGPLTFICLILGVWQFFLKQRQIIWYLVLDDLIFPIFCCNAPMASYASYYFLRIKEYHILSFGIILSQKCGKLVFHYYLNCLAWTVPFCMVIQSMQLY